MKTNEIFILGYSKGLDKKDQHTNGQHFLIACYEKLTDVVESLNESHEQFKIKTISLSYAGIINRFKKERSVILFDKSKHQTEQFALESADYVVIRKIELIKSLK